MDRRTFSLSAIGAIVTSLTACGGGGGESSNPQAAPGNQVPAKDATVVVQPSAPAVELASATMLRAGTVFLQSVAATDGDAEAAPGQANFWDLRTNLSLGDGYNNQFVGALNLSVELGGVVQNFPADQTYSGLTAWGPALGTGDGVKAVTFVDTGAHIHPARGAGLQQTLDLGNAVGPISLTWTSFYQPDAFGDGTSETFIDAPFSWQVVLRDSAGQLRETLFRVDQTGTSGTGLDGSANLSHYFNEIVVLSFEHDSGYSSLVSSVSVKDSANTQYVTNGNFAAGGRGWHVPSLQVSQNVQSDPRTLHGLEVRRMFYTQPDAMWGRWTDCFANLTGNPIAVAVSYDSTLGSEGRGVIYLTPGANDKALTSWDGGGGGSGGNDRDIGMVFGSAVAKLARSATTLQSASPGGIATIKFTHSINVPAGGSVALVNFIIMSGTDTGKTASDVNARATGVDVLAADIANNFRTNFAYQRGMMQAQLDTLKNF